MRLLERGNKKDKGYTVMSNHHLRTATAPGTEAKGIGRRIPLIDFLVSK